MTTTKGWLPVVAAVLIMSAAPSAASAAAAAATSPSRSPESSAALRTADEPAPTGIQQWGACVDEKGGGDLLLLMDQSGSLGGADGTDPDAVRVTAASILVEGLAEWSADSQSVLDIAVAGFDATYQPVADWRRLDAPAVTATQQALTVFADRDSGLDTDYITALDGARAAMRAKAESSGDDRCQAVVWFSDGDLDIDPRITTTQQDTYGTTKTYAPGVELLDETRATEVMSVGREELCRDGGVADQLRAGGVLTLAVGLGSSNFDLMQAVAVGTGGSETCGATGSPATGEFISAGEVEDLLFVLKELSNPEGIVNYSSEVCVDTPCVEGTNTFVLDDVVSAIDILAGTTAPGNDSSTATPAVDIDLVGPNGGTVTIGAADPRAGASYTLDGLELDVVRLSERTVDIKVAREPDLPWEGAWSVVFVNRSGRPAGAQARTQVHIKGDLVARPAVEPLEGRVGEVVALPLDLVREGDGSIVTDPQVLARSELSVAVRRGDGDLTAVGSGTAAELAAEPLSIDLTDAEPGVMTVEVTLGVTTAGVPATGGRPAVPGTRLTDRLVAVDMNVLLPPEFPPLPAAFDFGSAEGTDPLLGVMVVSGPGCVWVDDPTITASPISADQISVVPERGTNAGNCVRLEEGESGEIRVVMTLEEQANGTIAGTLTAHLAPLDEPDREITAPVKFLGSVTKLPDVPFFLLTFLGALAISIAVPLGLLYGIAWWKARIPGQPILKALIPATVTGTTVLRGGAPFAVSINEVEFVQANSAGERQLQIDGVTLTAVTSARPDVPGHVIAATPGREVITEGSGDTFDRMLLAVHNSWVAIITDRASDSVDVLVMMHAMAPASAYVDVAERVRRELPERLAALRESPPPGENGKVPVHSGATPDFATQAGATDGASLSKRLSDRISRKKPADAEKDWEQW